MADSIPISALPPRAAAKNSCLKMLWEAQKLADGARLELVRADPSWASLGVMREFDALNKMMLKIQSSVQGISI